MRRVLVLNNYSLDSVWEEVRLGEKPDHHLFGVNYFEARGYQPIIVPFRAGRWTLWQRAMRAIRVPVDLGDLQQQREAFRTLRRGDLVYAPCATQTHTLQYLRALGLFKAPIVCLVHHPFVKGRADLIRRPQRRLFVRGADVLPSLSHAVARGLREVGAPAGRTQALQWGPDAAYYRPQSTAGSGVVAAGRTGRDFRTVIRAARRVASPVVLIGFEDHFRGESSNRPLNLRLLPQPKDPPCPGRRTGWMKYPELLRHLGDARAIAIPLERQSHLCGVTSLMDALGLGKPVIMTRNPQIDLDIEALGIGIWVEPEDVEGWIHAIRWFEAHPAEAVAMGARARELVDRGLNSKSFANQVMDLFDRLSA